HHPTLTLFPYTTLFRSEQLKHRLAEDIDVIITTGGTGIAQRDVTIEAVSSLITKEIEGFGELFRYLSYTEDVGTRALLSRAIARSEEHTSELQSRFDLV